MRLPLAILTLGLAGAHVLAVEAPPSITGARVEALASATPSQALEQMARSADTWWVGWSVRAIAKATDVCCLSDSFQHRGCSLVQPEHGWGTTDHEGRNDEHLLYVLVETKDGQARRVKIVSPDCPVDAGGRRLVWLGAADSGASLSALTELLERPGAPEDFVDTLLVAIAYHDDPRADAVIEKRALDREGTEKSRKQAVFWAGQARGETGVRLCKRVATDDPVAEVRAHALFALSQSRAGDAGAWITGRLDAERDDHVRDQAVFALSQLPDGTDWLLKVLHSKRDAATIKRAFFWLGQSKDPRALEEIEKVLDRPARPS